MSLDKVVIVLRTNVFSHGQLYTAFSRIRKREDCLVLLADGDVSGRVLTVMYEELIQ